MTAVAGASTPVVVGTAAGESTPSGGISAGGSAGGPLAGGDSFRNPNR